MLGSSDCEETDGDGGESKSDELGPSDALEQQHAREQQGSGGIGDAVRPVRAGATTVFAADVPHAYEGAGRGPCELIMTVHLPLEHHSADRGGTAPNRGTST